VRGTSELCSSGPFAATAKNGKPADTVKSPMSQHASPDSGGFVHPVGSAIGSAAVAASKRQIGWPSLETRPTR
jgi:hypothetical protein